MVRYLGKPIELESFISEPEPDARAVARYLETHDAE